MNDVIEKVSGSIVSYLLATTGLVSQENIVFLLGAAALFVRLIYDTIRLIRYIRNPLMKHKDD